MLQLSEFAVLFAFNCLYFYESHNPLKFRVHIMDMKELAEALKARYSENLGVVVVRLGRREVNFFASGRVTIREVNDIEEGKKLVNSILAMSAQKQILKEL